MAHILLMIVLFDNLKVWLDRPLNFIYTHYTSQVCNISRYGLKMAKFRTVENGRLAARMGHNAHAVREKRPDVEKLIVFKSCHWYLL